VEGGRLIHSLPYSIDGVAHKLIDGNEAVTPLISDYANAFETDIINLLIGPLAEAKHVHSRDDERFNHHLVALPSLKNYGGGSDLALVYEYLESYSGDKQKQDEKLGELFAVAFAFVNDSAHWKAITKLANYILESHKNIIGYEEVVAVLGPQKLSLRHSMMTDERVNTMNKHLALVREFHGAFLFPQARHGENIRLSEMDIILRQALLMEEGSDLFKAIRSGDMANILAGMVNLAYCALDAIALQGADVTDQPVSWQHDGFVLSLTRLFSGQIHNCASGDPDDYSKIYCLCVYLSRNFINADFDKAFQMVHGSKMSLLDKGGHPAEKMPKPTFFKTPDLSDCLYE
jgi:hypothetical protein